MKCEYCDKEHDGSYGSGRFCSAYCARGYSSMVNIPKRNKGISRGLKNYHKNAEKKFICCECNKQFLNESTYRNHIENKICIKQKREFRTKEEVNEILSKKRIQKIKEGYINNPSKIEVLYKDTVIKCDSKLEVAALEYLRGIGEEFIERNFDVVEYVFEGQTKRFLPDFITDNYLVEVKSVVSNSLSKKWHSYKEKIPFKKEALKRQAEKINKADLWLDKTNKELRKLYRNFYGKSIIKYELK